MSQEHVSIGPNPISGMRTYPNWQRRQAQTLLMCEFKSHRLHLCHEMTLDDNSLPGYTECRKTRKVTTMNYVTINQQFKEEQFSKQFCEKQECSSFSVNCRLVVISG